MNHNAYLTEHLAQLTLAEVERAARCAWLQPPPYRPSLGNVLVTGLLVAASSLAGLLWLLS
jgi:hypothetical protein